MSVDLSAVRGVSPRDATLPLWLVMITLVVAIGTVPLSLVEEREEKTLRALLVAPVPRSILLLAKALVAVASILAMCVLVVVFNGVTVNDPALLAIALVAGAIAFVPVGLAVGAFATNQTAVSPFGGLLLVALMLPVALSQTEASAINSIAQLLPSGALATVVRAAAISGAGGGEFIAQLAYLVGVGIGAGAVALWAIGRESVMLT